MTNDLSRLQTALALQLGDESYDTWTGVEMEDLITWSVANLYPRYARELDPLNADTQITLVSGSYFYDLDSTIRLLQRVDLIGPVGGDGVTRQDYGRVDGSNWEVVGNLEDGTASLRFNHTLNDAFPGGYLRLHGLALYDLDAYAIPDRLVPLVLATARAEAYRRMAGDRARFKAWLTKNQGQNITVNELIQLVNEADNEIQRLRGTTQRTWGKPVPGRQG